MSPMPPTAGHSAACCNVPPVVTSGYEAKGKYEELGGLNTYVTGPAGASKGVLFIFDIFGYFEQSLQGADIIATSGNTDQYRVFIPDWFLGEPADISWYPPQTDEHKKNLGAFFGKNSPPRVAALVPDYIKAVEAKYPEIKSWAIIGFCWGGKVVSLVASETSPFKAAVACHPAMVDPNDAKAIKVPMCMLASKDEDVDAVEKFDENLTVEGKHIEIFGDQIHGWMAARSDLSNERVKAEYKRGYETVVDFYAKYFK